MREAKKHKESRNKRRQLGWTKKVLNGAMLCEEMQQPRKTKICEDKDLQGQEFGKE